MDDISGNEKRRVSNRRQVGVVAGFIVVGTLVGATWLHVANDNYAPGTRVPPRPAGIEPAVAPEVGQTGMELPSDTRSANPAGELAPDDEVDIALGGSWGSDDCTNVPVQVVKASTGELVEALDCQRSSPRPIHAYEAYANDALESLAYSDPIAGLVLGRRLAETDPESTWNLMIRSAALLGGDTRPIKWLAARSFNQVKTADGEMATETMQLRYVLDSLARRLEHKPDPSFDFREYYLRDSLGDAEFEQLDHMVNALLNKMRVIEDETTGNRSGGGLGS